MRVSFTKMHGLGNDFVVLDLISQDITLQEEQVRILADRHRGIGFDQLLTVEPPSNPEADFLYRIFNSDGREVEQCGNGARCLILFLRQKRFTAKKSIILETKGGHLTCKIEEGDNVSVNMGVPKLDPKDIPFLSEKREVFYNIPIGNNNDKKGDFSQVRLSAVNIGNPHAVILVNDIKEAPLNELGPIIESHSSFPKKANVGFMQIMNRSEIALRVYERGVGETLACGTGACAAVVAGRLQGRLDSKVKVHLAGGSLLIRWPGQNRNIHMAGPACRVFEGNIKI